MEQHSDLYYNMVIYSNLVSALLAYLTLSTVDSFHSSYLFPKIVSHSHDVMKLYDTEIDSLKTHSQWWLNTELHFKCTGCGKCCSNEGEVWLDIDEFVQISDQFNLSTTEFLEKYVSHIKSDWTKLKEQNDSSKNGGSSCIFLAEDMKTCSIYKSRPTQCRTYPYWPQILLSENSWKDEVVSPNLDDSQDMIIPESIKTKFWSPQSGGCEGIFLVNDSRRNDTAVSTSLIYRNYMLEKMYHDSFPFMESGDDRNRLIAKCNVMRKVITSTKAWVQNFVIKYKLCPFADQVFKDDTIRYRVFLGSSKDKILQRVKYEVRRTTLRMILRIQLLLFIRCSHF